MSSNADESSWPPAPSRAFEVVGGLDGSDGLSLLQEVAKSAARQISKTKAERDTLLDTLLADLDANSGQLRDLVQDDLGGLPLTIVLLARQLANGASVQAVCQKVRQQPLASLEAAEDNRLHLRGGTTLPPRACVCLACFLHVCA